MTDALHRPPPFPPEEYPPRIERLRRLMHARGLDAVLADECEMLHYYTGWSVSLNLYRCVLVPRHGEPLMVVRHLDEQPFLDAAWFSRRIAFADTEDPLEATARGLAELGAGRGRVGLDLDSYAMPAGRFSRLAARLPGAELVDLSDALRAERLIKSPREIEHLRAAAAIADAAMAEAVEATAAGASARRAAAGASAAFVRLGADTGRTGPISVARGWNFLHGALDDAALGDGDVLHLELVPKVRGYCARLMRPVAVGEPGPARRAAAQTLVALQDRQIAAMGTGAEARAVDAVVRDGVLAAGLRERYENNTGYTLGYYFEQAPRTSDFTRVLTPAADWRLENDMVFHVYTSAGGVAFSETVRVTPEGGERLTRLPRELFLR